MNIIIIYNKIKDYKSKNLKKLLYFLKNEDVKYTINSFFNNVNKTLYNEQYDFVITLGGDGTVMHGCKYALKYNIPVIGINIGNLGFLTQLNINNIETLKKIFINDYKIEERAIIESQINDNKIYYAINDVVIARSEVVKLVDLVLYCNNQKVSSYRSDGLICSTPTGSTAYSLSSGGPIVDCSMQGIIVTPICSHSLNARPVIFGEDKSLKIVSKSQYKLKVSIDGNLIQDLYKNQFVNIKISNKKCKFINFNNRHYLKIFDNPI